MKEKKLTNKSVMLNDYPAHYLPPEIIWLIFTYSDMLTLARCSRACSDWNILSQPFWIEELAIFLERMKNKKESFREMDVFHLVNCAQEKGSTNYILNELHRLEAKIKNSQAKLSLIKEREREKITMFQQDSTVMVVDPLGGYAYQSDYPISFFSDIKRMFYKARHKNNIEEAEKKEGKIIKMLEM